MMLYTDIGPAGRLGEVSPCERSENLEGVWGRAGAPKVPQKCISRWSVGQGQMVVLQPFVPLGNSGTVPGRSPRGPPVGWWRILKKHCYLRCFWPAAAEKGDFYSVFSIFLNVGWWRSLTKTLLYAAFFARCG